MLLDLKHYITYYGQDKIADITTSTSNLISYTNNRSNIALIHNLRHAHHENERTSQKDI
jgi:hypothetical protein